jgi:uncharacterized protein (DUF2141 family)
MNKFIILLVVSLLSSSIQILSNPDIADLIVNIDNIENDEGNIRVHLYDESVKESFPIHPDNAIRLEISYITNKKAKVIFKNMPYSKYALTVHHDKNLNVKMDLNILGLPAEGWGVSNNIKPFMRIPDFDECSFYADKKTTSINITMNN